MFLDDKKTFYFFSFHVVFRVRIHPGDCKYGVPCSNRARSSPPQLASSLPHAPQGELAITCIGYVLLELGTLESSNTNGSSNITYYNQFWRHMLLRNLMGYVLLGLGTLESSNTNSSSDITITNLGGICSLGNT